MPTGMITPTPADLFRQMAERIERNAPTEFAGAVLLIPPGNETPIEILLVNPRPDMEHFWSTCEAQVKAAQMEWMQRTQGTVPMPGFGRR